MALTPQQRSAKIQQAKAAIQKALDGIHADMDRVDEQLDALDQKVGSGATLTDAEKEQQQVLRDSMDTLGDVEQRIVLWSLDALDNSAAIAAIKSQVDQANQDLTAAKQQILDLTQKLTTLGTILTGVTNTLTGLAHLLAALA